MAIPIIPIRPNKEFIMLNFFKRISQAACTNLKYIYTSVVAQDQISKCFQKLPIWARFGLLFFVYAIFVSIVLPIFAIAIYSIVLDEIQTGWNVLFGCRQYDVLYYLIHCLYKDYMSFYHLNNQYPPMDLGWQLKYFGQLLGCQSHTLITFYVVIIFHSFALAQFQFWAGAIIAFKNKQSVPVKKLFSMKQFTIDTVFFAFMVISFGFFNGGGGSAAFFLWGIATFGNILGFSAKLQ